MTYVIRRVLRITAEIAKNCGVFFGSILGTLNHILVADMFWLRRFSSSKMCRDALILNFSETWNDELLATPIRYRNMAGEKHQQALGSLLQHLTKSAKRIPLAPE